MKALVTLAMAITLGSVSVQAEEVYFLYGAVGPAASLGMKDMVDTLKSKGVNAKIGSSSSATDIIKRHKAGARVSYPIVLAGHSIGGVHVAKMANRLTAAGVPVRLLIGIDAGFFPSPAKIKRGTKSVISYKVTTGGKMGPTYHYKGAKGFNGSISNINVNEEISPRLSHTNLDDDKEFQRIVVRKVLNVL